MSEMTSDDSLDSYLLMPCCEGNDEKKKNGPNHSVTGWFEVENKPLRIETVLFVGSFRRLKTQMKRKEGLEFTKEDMKMAFSGVSGVTFPCQRSDGSSFVAIWMPKFDWSIIDIETLSHECLHAAVMVMRMSGTRAKIFTAVDEEDVDDEGLCYRQATMLTNLLKKMVAKQNRMLAKWMKSPKAAKSPKRCMKR